MAVTNDPRFGTSVWGAGTDPWPARPGWNTLIGKITGTAAIWTEGTYAARPAFSAAKFGTLYYATDQDRLYLNTKTKWIEVSPVGGGGPGKRSEGRSGTEGTSRSGARSDHTHPDQVYAQRSMYNGDLNGIGAYSTAHPTKVYSGFSIQVSSPTGILDFEIPEAASCIITCVVTPFYTGNGERVDWYPLVRGDLSLLNPPMVRIQSRTLAGGVLPSAKVGFTFQCTYQTAT